MASIRKRNGKWQVQVRRKELGAESQSFTRRDDALKWARIQEQRMEAGTFGHLMPSEVTLGDLLHRYLHAVTPVKKGATQEARRIRRLLSDPICLNTINRLRPHTLSQFRDRRLKDGIRASQYDLVIIKHCLKIAKCEWGLAIDVNPVDFVQMPPSSPPRDRRLAKGEYERLQGAAEGLRNLLIWPIIDMAIETAMRRSEILSLTWENVDIQNGTCYLPMTKNGSPRTVPLTSKALRIAKSLPQNSELVFPISSNAVRLSWDRLRSRAGINDLRFHDLRHEAISRFFERGLSIAEVALISGHKDPRMLFRYTHLRAEDVAKKLQK